jgi:oxygen-dependent protoporphyrinogen oxidase
MSLGGLVRVMREPFIPRGAPPTDESVWQFTARRLGVQVADRLIAPMTLGVFAGDARQLSVESTFPRMAALERDHGSIIRGMIAKRGKTSVGSLTSFRAGMQALPIALADRGGFAVRCGAEARAVARRDAGWEVRVAGDREAIPADAVILAAEPFAAGPLLRPYAESAAADLEAIACPPVSVVGLGYAAEGAARVPHGFGVLIARGEGLRGLGHLWESRSYPGRSPAGHVLIRVLFGGELDAAAGALSEAELVALARREVERVYAITAPPTMQTVHRWPRAIPQYELGHGQRVQRIEDAVAALPGVFITGYGLRGIGFADAAVNGVRCGQRVGQWLRASRSRSSLTRPLTTPAPPPARDVAPNPGT